MNHLMPSPSVHSHHQQPHHHRYQPYSNRPMTTASHFNQYHTLSNPLIDPFTLRPYMVPPTYDPKPATLTTIQWEDEKTFCYLVEIKGISVGRRKDNNMINGTKLLNLSGMTRGKRDGILKSELERSVIKSGLMVLKGVWITFERAKELAKEYGIHDMLHPLLEWDIESHYYRPILDVGPQHPLSNEHRWGMPLTTTVKPLHPPKLPLPLHSLPPMTSMVSASAVPSLPIPFSQPAAPPQWNNISYASVPPMAQAQPIHMPRSSNSPTISSPILNETMVTAATYAHAPPPSEHFMSPPSYSPAPFQWDPSSTMYPTSSAGGPYSDTIVPVSNYSNIDYESKDAYNHAHMTSQNHH